MVLRHTSGLNLYKSCVFVSITIWFLITRILPIIYHHGHPPRWTADHISSTVARQVGVPSRGCAPLGVVRAGPLASQMGIFFTDVVIRDNSGSYGGRPSRSTSRSRLTSSVAAQTFVWVQGGLRRRVSWAATNVHEVKQQP